VTVTRQPSFKAFKDALSQCRIFDFFTGQERKNQQIVACALGRYDCAVTNESSPPRLWLTRANTLHVIVHKRSGLARN
jgi:hypothetical protein